MPVVTKSSWRVNYEWSASSGLRIGQADYQGIRVLHTASVPFVYVSYAGDAFGPFTDELRSVSPKVEVRDIMHGFDLKVSYDSYGEDYQYEHVWRFHDDGQFAAKIVVHGPGEEIHGKHVYNIPFRFDLDLSGESNDSFQRRLASGRWADIAKEGRFPPGGTTGYQWRVVDRVNDRRALIRPGFGDDAEVWALAYKEVEAWSSWGGAQASAPGSPGGVPAIYDNNQSVQATDLVIWYIARIASGDLVRACGPWFRLDGFPPPEEHDDHNGHNDHADH